MVISQTPRKVKGGTESNIPCHDAQLKMENPSEAQRV